MKNLIGILGSTAISPDYGVSFAFTNYPILAEVDCVLPNDNNLYFNLGGEYNFEDKFFARVGVSTKDQSNTNMTFGIGLKESGFNFDYAYVPYGDLGTTHRVSITMFPDIYSRMTKFRQR